LGLVFRRDVNKPGRHCRRPLLDDTGSGGNRIL
jgi:hypothetical protein